MNAQKNAKTGRKNARKSKPSFRLILQEEGTFAEKWALRVKPGHLKWLAFGSVFSISLLTYALIALTPLREWVVPGYDSSETRRMQNEAWQMADSLSRAMDTQARYIANMMAVLEGRVAPNADQDSLPPQSPDEPGPVAPPNSPSLDRLRNEIAEEDAFTIGRPGGLDDAGIWLAPVDGRISSGWNPVSGHWGIDLVAPENSPVKAVGDGTVVYAGFTAGGGHTLMVQHAANRISVYMHNSRLEVSTGDRVRRGDVVAIIGNSGDHSTGPHLHFEWWESGNPVDPQLRINL